MFPESPNLAVYVPITISWGEHEYSCQALVDSRAADDFIDNNLSRRLKIPQIALKTLLVVTALDGRALGNGKAEIHITRQKYTAFGEKCYLANYYK